MSSIEKFAQQVERFDLVMAAAILMLFGDAADDVVFEGETKPSLAKRFASLLAEVDSAGVIGLAQQIGDSLVQVQSALQQALHYRGVALDTGKALSNGVIDIVVTAATGSDGTYDVVFTPVSGGSAAKGKIVKAGTTLTYVSESRGYDYAAAPTITAPGLTGISATVVIGPNATVGDSFAVIQPSGAVFRYRVDAGPVATYVGEQAGADTITHGAESGLLDEFYDNLGNLVRAMRASDGGLLLPGLGGMSIQEFVAAAAASVERDSDAYYLIKHFSSDNQLIYALRAADGGLEVAGLDGKTVQEVLTELADFDASKFLTITAPHLPLGDRAQALIVRDAEDAGYNSGRVYTAIPSVARTGTRLWSGWTANKLNNINGGEQPGSFAVIAYSDDDGATWQEYMYIAHPVPAVGRIADPTLDYRDGILYIYYFQTGAGKSYDSAVGTWQVSVKNPSAALPLISISKPVRLAYGMFVTSVACINETAYLPIFAYSDMVANGNTVLAQNPEIYKGVTLYQRHGRSLVPTGRIPYDLAANDFIEPSVVQCIDGSLLALVRYTTGLYIQRSDDDGVTWSAKQLLSALAGITASTASKASLTVTASGRLCLVWNNSASRASMTIALSEDSGVTWSHAVVLDARLNTSYPSVCHAGDAIYVVWDFERTFARQIQFCKLSEAAILAGTQIVNRVVINSR